MVLSHAEHHKTADVPSHALYSSGVDALRPDRARQSVTSCQQCAIFEHLCRRADSSSKQRHDCWLERDVLETVQLSLLMDVMATHLADAVTVS